MLKHLVSTALTIALCMHCAHGKNAKDNNQSSFVRGCYLTNWAQYRPGNGSFFARYYQPGMCTHAFLAFAKLTPNFEITHSDWNDENEFYSVMRNFKQQDPNLKVLISLGGWSFGTDMFESMARSSGKRAIFARSLLRFIKEHDFDGFDLDWEYPKQPEDFVRLLKTISQRFNWAKRRKGKELLLTAAVSSSPERIEAGYDVPSIHRYVDFVNLMTYDFHGAWEMRTGIHSPLRFRKEETPYMATLNTEAAANIWHELGMPKQKIIIGLPAYGRGWTLENVSERNLGARAVGPSNKMPYTREEGIIAYYECCDLINKGAKTHRELEAAILTQDNQWFAYDDEETFETKLQWTKNNSYGGAFVWSLDLDDFSGLFCSGQNQTTKYPLTATMKRVLGS